MSVTDQAPSAVERLPYWKNGSTTFAHSQVELLINKNNIYKQNNFRVIKFTIYVAPSARVSPTSPLPPPSSSTPTAAKISLPPNLPPKMTLSIQNWPAGLFFVIIFQAQLTTTIT